jgi:hypothetical protein
MSADLLANVERIEGPAPQQAAPEFPPGWWDGSAVGAVQYWRARALAAETKLAALRSLLTGERWVPHT